MTSPLSDRPDAFARIRAGDRSAFEALFREHYAGLCEFVYRYVQSREAAEDVTQEVFLNVWSRRDALDARESVRAYLYGAARNRALNSIEHQRVEQRWAERAVHEHESAPSPADSDEGEVAQKVATVQTAIDRLPERARLAITLRWHHGLKYSEIASVMGISVKGVENQLGRAMGMLREILKD